MSQIFKTKIPITILYDFLAKNAWEHKTYYVFDIDTYRKIKFNGNSTMFLDLVKEYYHNSKRYYTERNDTYNNFITVLRQICKNNSIAYTSLKLYQHSSYKISYHIYKPGV